MDELKNESITANPDQLPFIEVEAERHPGPMIRLLREAVDKALMNDQRELWEMYAYDKLLPAEIALKLKLNKSTVSRRLAVIKRKLIKYCKEKDTYENEGC